MFTSVLTNSTPSRAYRLLFFFSFTLAIKGGCVIIIDYMGENLIWRSTLLKINISKWEIVS